MPRPRSSNGSFDAVNGDGDGLNVHWYPGHMAKARRQLLVLLPLVDAVLEVADARIPISSRNPDLAGLLGAKPRVLLLARADLADPEVTQAWVEYFRKAGQPTVAANLRQAGWQQAVVRLLRQAADRGRSGLRAMVVGIPNCGKSTAINALARRRGARTGNQPGVTKGPQWLSGPQGLELLDTPGLLWPKLEQPRTRFGLAATGAVPDRLVNVEQLALHLVRVLQIRYPEALRSRYGPGESLPPPGDAEEWLRQIARARGALRKGGELDLEQAAAALLQDFRAGRLGRITLEMPPSQFHEAADNPAERPDDPAERP